MAKTCELFFPPEEYGEEYGGECGRPSFTRGLCQTHWRQIEKLRIPPKPVGMGIQCKHPSLRRRKVERLSPGDNNRHTASAALRNNGEASFQVEIKEPVAPHRQKPAKRKRLKPTKPAAKPAKPARRRTRAKPAKPTRRRTSNGTSVADRAYAYAKAVLENPKDHCRTQVLAVERFLALSEKYDLDLDAVNRVGEFVESMPLGLRLDGAFNPMSLLPWQAFFLLHVFGLKKPDGFRLTNSVMLYIPKKQGKSSFCALLGAYMFLEDGEESPNVVFAASREDQARIAFATACASIRKKAEEDDGHASEWAAERGLGHFCRSSRSLKPNKITLENGGEMLPVPRDSSGSLDGLDISCLLQDELHAQKTESSTFDVLKGGLIARKQPLVLVFTTAGFGDNLATQEMQNSKDILEGRAVDDSHAALLWMPDPGVKPSKLLTLKQYRKCNPSMELVNESMVRTSIKKARNGDKRAERQFLVKNLNVSLQDAGEFLDMSRFDSLAIPQDKWNPGSDCPVYVGIDLSSHEDLSAVAYIYKKDGTIFAKAHAYQCRNTIKKVPYYQTWVNEGHLLEAGQDGIDYDVIERHIEEECSTFNTGAIAYDAYRMHTLSSRLEKSIGVDVVSIPQGGQTMGAALQMWENAVNTSSFRWVYNKCFRWCVSNVVVVWKAGDKAMPQKASQGLKIDVAQALLNAVKLLDIMEAKPEEKAEEKKVVKFTGTATWR